VNCSLSSICAILELRINERVIIMEINEERHESSTQIIKNMARNILKKNKGKEIYLKDIRRIIAREFNQPFSPGVYSSAMRDLIDEEDGRIINVDRGIYMYVDSVKKHEINKVLEECIQSLKASAYVDYLNTDEQEFQYIKQIPKIVESIENMKFK